MKVIDIARGQAHLVSVKKDSALYSIDYYDNDDKGKAKSYLINIPLDEIGDGLLMREEKAGMLLKWIREDVKRSKEL